MQNKQDLGKIVLNRAFRRIEHPLPFVSPRPEIREIVRMQAAGSGISVSIFDFDLAGRDNDPSTFRGKEGSNG